MRRNLLVAALMAVLAPTVLPATAAHPVASDLDPGFAAGEMFRLDLGGPSVDVVHALSKGWVVGSAGPNMAVASIWGSGTVKREFANEGRVTADFGRPSTAYAILGDRTPMVIAGSAGDDFALAAFDDGNPYAYFGEFGQVTTSFGAPAVARGLVFTLQGDHVAVGEASVGEGGSVAMASYNVRGELVPTFGDAGKVVDDITPGFDSANAGVRLSNEILVAGRAGPDVLLARYHRDGTPDLSFGAGGKVVVSLSDGDDAAAAIVVLLDGRIAISGTAGDQGFIGLFSENGVPDPTYGQGGFVFSDLGGPTSFSEVRDDRRQGVAAAGVVRTPSGNDAVVVDTVADGSPRTDFGTSGVLRVDLGGAADTTGGLSFADGAKLAGSDGQDMIVIPFDDHGNPISESDRVVVDFGRPSNDNGERTLVQPDGKVIVAGWGGSGFILVRLLANGSLDPSFRPGRPVVQELGKVMPSDLTLQPDGKILVNAEGVVQRFTASGELDQTFAKAGGFLEWSGNDMVLQPDGRIIVSDATRLEPSGSRDPTFDVEGNVQYAFEVLLQPDGKPVIAARRSLTGDTSMVMYRFNPDGSRDSSFFSAHFPAVPGTPWAFTERRDGGFAALNLVSPGGPEMHDEMAVVAYTSSGSPDYRFRNGVMATLDLGAIEHPVEILTQPDGKMVVVANVVEGSSTSVQMLRLLPTGQVDRSFGVGGIFKTSGFRWANGAALAPDGSVVVVGSVKGSADDDLGVVRYQPNRTTPAAVQGAGWNVLGQLGDGTTTDRPSPTPVPAVPDAVAVAAGVYHSLALRSDGTVWAWGWNGVGQLGDGTAMDRHTPTRVPGLTGITSIAAGAYHSLALKDDGTVWSWGWNPYGALGDGTTFDRHAPVRVTGLAPAKAISAGIVHSMALLRDGTVRTWGWNGVGQLGTGSTVDSRLPAAPGLHGIDAISAGGYHSLAVGNDGRVISWGWNAYGQLGRTGDPLRPSAELGVTDAVSVSGGALHSVALSRSGTLLAWGLNGSGQNGDVWRTTGVVAVSAGYFHTVAVREDGVILAWGWNGLGQLGTGDTVDRLMPTPMLGGGSRGFMVSAGAYHTLVA